MTTIYLDLETTGLSAKTDEILQIGILGNDGKVLFDSFVKPARKKVWREAQQINKISPKMVKDAPPLADLLPQIIEVVTGKDVVIYNAKFDYGFLPDALDHAASIQCCMLEFMDFLGVKRWKSLIFAADYIDYKWQGQKHSAIADCRATRAV